MANGLPAKHMWTTEPGRRVDNTVEDGVRKAKTHEFFCDFRDKKNCGIENDVNNDYNWELFNGFGDGDGTGPGKAWVNQWFIMSEAFGHKENDTARMYLPTMPAGDNYYLSFRYSMVGTWMGTLTVYHHRTNPQGKPDKRILWTLHGNQGPHPKWRKDEIGFINLKKGDRISFESTRGETFSSDMALDTIRLVWPNTKRPQDMS